MAQNASSGSSSPEASARKRRSSSLTLRVAMRNIPIKALPRPDRFTQDATSEEVLQDVQIVFPSAVRPSLCGIHHPPGAARLVLPNRRPRVDTVTVSALSAAPQITVPADQVSRDVLLAAMKDSILATAELNVIYSRGDTRGTG